MGKGRPNKIYLQPEHRYEQYIKDNGKEPPASLVKFWEKNTKRLNALKDDSLAARKAKSDAVSKRMLKDRVALLLDIEAGELPDDILPEDVDEKMKEWSVETLMSVKQIKKALEGDTNAYKELMDRGRGKAVQKVEQEVTSNVSIKPIEWLSEVPEAEVVEDEDEDMSTKIDTNENH
jgi:hypothetical protein